MEPLRLVAMNTYSRCLSHCDCLRWMRASRVLPPTRLQPLHQNRNATPRPDSYCALSFFPLGVLPTYRSPRRSYGNLLPHLLPRRIFEPHLNPARGSIPSLGCNARYVYDLPTSPAIFLSPKAEGRQPNGLPISGLTNASRNARFSPKRMRARTTSTKSRPADCPTTRCKA